MDDGGNDGPPLERIREVFHLSARDACNELGLSQSRLKKICRQHGISRWPHRKLASLEALRAQVQNEGILPAEELKALLSRLDEQVAAVLEDPDRPLEKEFADMRQTSYKVRYHQRSRQRNQQRLAGGGAHPGDDADSEDDEEDDEEEEPPPRPRAAAARGAARAAAEGGARLQSPPASPRRRTSATTGAAAGAGAGRGAGRRGSHGSAVSPPSRAEGPARRGAAAVPGLHEDSHSLQAHAPTRDRGMHLTACQHATGSVSTAAAATGAAGAGIGTGSFSSHSRSLVTTGDEGHTCGSAGRGGRRSVGSAAPVAACTADVAAQDVIADTQAQRTRSPPAAPQRLHRLSRQGQALGAPEQAQPFYLHQQMQHQEQEEALRQQQQADPQAAPAQRPLAQGVLHPGEVGGGARFDGDGAQLPVWQDALAVVAPMALMQHAPRGVPRAAAVDDDKGSAASGAATQHGAGDAEDTAQPQHLVPTVDTATAKPSLASGAPGVAAAAPLTAPESMQGGCETERLALPPPSPTAALRSEAVAAAGLPDTDAGPEEMLYDGGMYGGGRRWSLGAAPMRFSIGGTECWEGSSLADGGLAGEEDLAGLRNIGAPYDGADPAARRTSQQEAGGAALVVDEPGRPPRPSEVGQAAADAHGVALDDLGSPLLPEDLPPAPWRQWASDGGDVNGGAGFGPRESLGCGEAAPGADGRRRRSSASGSGLPPWVPPGATTGKQQPRDPLPALVGSSSHTAGFALWAHWRGVDLGGPASGAGSGPGDSRLQQQQQPRQQAPPPPVRTEQEHEWRPALPSQGQRAQAQPPPQQPLQQQHHYEGHGFQRQQVTLSDYRFAVADRPAGPFASVTAASLEQQAAVPAGGPEPAEDPWVSTGLGPIVARPDGRGGRTAATSDVGDEDPAWEPLFSGSDPHVVVRGPSGEVHAADRSPGGALRRASMEWGSGGAAADSTSPHTPSAIRATVAAAAKAAAAAAIGAQPPQPCRRDAVHPTREDSQLRQEQRHGIGYGQEPPQWTLPTPASASAIAAEEDFGPRPAQPRPPPWSRHGVAPPATLPHRPPSASADQWVASYRGRALSQSSAPYALYERRMSMYDTHRQAPPPGWYGSAEAQRPRARSSSPPPGGVIDWADGRGIGETHAGPRSPMPAWQPSTDLPSLRTSQPPHAHAPQPHSQARSGLTPRQRAILALTSAPPQTAAQNQQQPQAQREGKPGLQECLPPAMPLSAGLRRDSRAAAAAADSAAQLRLRLSTGSTGTRSPATWGQFEGVAIGGIKTSAALSRPGPPQQPPAAHTHSATSAGHHGPFGVRAGTGDGSIVDGGSGEPQPRLQRHASDGSSGGGSGGGSGGVAAVWGQAAATAMGLGSRDAITMPDPHAGAVAPGPAAGPQPVLSSLRPAAHASQQHPQPSNAAPGVPAVLPPAHSGDSHAASVTASAARAPPGPDSAPVRTPQGPDWSRLQSAPTAVSASAAAARGHAAAGPEAAAARLLSAAAGGGGDGKAGAAGASGGDGPSLPFVALPPMPSLPPDLLALMEAPPSESQESQFPHAPHLAGRALPPQPQAHQDIQQQALQHSSLLQARKRGHELEPGLEGDAKRLRPGRLPVNAPTLGEASPYTPPAMAATGPAALPAVTSGVAGTLAAPPAPLRRPQPAGLDAGTFRHGWRQPAVTASGGAAQKPAGAFASARSRLAGDDLYGSRYDSFGLPPRRPSHAASVGSGGEAMPGMGMGMSSAGHGTSAEAAAGGLVSMRRSQAQPPPPQQQPLLQDSAWGRTVPPIHSPAAGARPLQPYDSAFSGGAFGSAPQRHASAGGPSRPLPAYESMPLMPQPPQQLLQSRQQHQLQHQELQRAGGAADALRAAWAGKRKLAEQGGWDQLMQE